MEMIPERGGAGGRLGRIDGYLAGMGGELTGSKSRKYIGRFEHVDGEICR